MKIYPSELYLTGQEDLNTIIDIIAVKNKTLKEFIYFPQKNEFEYISEKIDNNEVIEFEDIFKIIKEDKSINLLKYFNNIKDFIPMDRVDVVNDVIKPWIYTRDFSSINNESIKKSILESFETDLRKISKEYVFDVYGDYSANAKDFEYNMKLRINKISQSLKGSQQIFMKLKETEPVEYSDFITDSISYKITVNSSIDIMVLFDCIKVSQTIPFCHYKNYYKILDNFIPPEDNWLEDIKSNTKNKEELENIIILKFNQSLYSKTQEEHKNIFTNLIIVKNGKTEYVMYLSVNQYVFNLNEKIILNKILNLFNPIYVNEQNYIKFIDDDLSNITIIKDKVSGYLYYKNFSFNVYIMSFLILNNKFFNILDIDEKRKAAKKIVGMNITYYNNSGNIYFKFESRNFNNLSYEIPKEIRESIREGESFSIVKIKSSKNIKNILKFSEIFGKLLTIYNEEKSTVLEQYKRKPFNIDILKDYPNFYTQVSQDLNIKGLKKKLTKMPPYSGKCEHMPLSTFSYEEAEKLAGKDKQILEYPFHNLVDKRYYYCPDDVYRYPGLTENTLKNKELYRCLPCCYKKDHINDPSSKLNNFCKTGVKKDIVQQAILKTEKFCKPYNFATMNKNLTKIFNIVGLGSANYIKTGVSDTKYSLIECVLTAFGLTFKYKKENKKLINFVVDIYTKILESDNIHILRQQFPKMNVDEIRDYVKTLDYIDPTVFVPVLEEYFDVYIFVFSNVEEGGNQIELKIPQASYIYKNKTRQNGCILIFENTGGKNEKNIFPRNELIIKNTTTTGLYDYIYHKKSIEFEYIQDLKNSYLNSKSLCIKNNFTNINLSLFFNIVSQEIDEFGKTRKIKIINNNREFTILTEPLEPFSVREEKLQIQKYSEEDFTIFNNREILGYFYKFSFFKNDRKDNFVRIVLADKTTTIYVPISFDNFDGNYGYYYLSENNNSFIKDFDRKSKIARCIQEYIFYIFSIYINENNITYPTEKDVEEFMLNNTVIEENFDYSEIQQFSPILDLYSPFLNSEQKIIVSDSEMLERLTFSLKVKNHNYPFYIKSYYKEIYMRNYFQSLKDFRNFNNQLIYDNLEKIKEDMLLSDNRGYREEFGYFYSKETPLKLSNTYFITNYFLSNYTLLCQNFISITDALVVAFNWLKNKTYSIRGTTLLQSYTEYKFTFSGEFVKTKKTEDNNIILIISEEIDDNSSMRNIYTICLPIKEINCF